MPSAKVTGDSLDISLLLSTLVAYRKGDFSARMPLDWTGAAGKVADTLNSVIETSDRMSRELAHLSRVVGKEGKLGQRLSLGDVTGAWAGQADSINILLEDLARPAAETARVIASVAQGDLSQRMSLESDGQPLQGSTLKTAQTVNTMVSQLSSFASEVTRVAREVGTEGKLGGQAEVAGISGTWKDLTDNVNSMAGNLTSQVRDIAAVTTAVANGDLSQKMTVGVKGEILELKQTISAMVDRLNSFASEVTRVAREVGTDGKLGGQASVPGAAGTWKDLTDNVNRLAANLTTQVRAITEVVTAVTKGDLTRSVRMEASGEVASLKDNINEMIGNLRDTTQKNTEQDWLKTNLAKFALRLQGQRDLLTVSRMILSELAPLVSAQHGVLYIVEEGKEEGQSRLKMLAGYAYKERMNLSAEFRLGEGLVGQCAVEKKRILLTNAPPDYLQITSGLGHGPPLNVIVLPILFEGAVRAVVELASFERFAEIHLTFLDQLTESIGIVLNTIQANMRTEKLLDQSQAMAQQLQSQQEELQQTNEELEEKARLLSDQKAEVERKNREVEGAKREVEEKAAQLALTSKYKSEFLSNMSHELRTPLNSLLMLAQQLAENSEDNLTPQQVKSAQTITSSGTDLLSLINDILDLSKIESGTVTVDIGDVSFDDLREFTERTFRHVAQNKGLEFEIELDGALPRSMSTDSKRLQQVLKNLLSNAFKFTEKGRVHLRIAPVADGWSSAREGLDRAVQVIAFCVSDTGIGIAAEKQRLIFEAFQQADGTTSRKYGGTGLGLSISREIAALLGGAIRVVSAPEKGSRFTLYLPLAHRPAPLPAPRIERPESRPARLRAERTEAAARSSPAVAVAERDVLDDRDTILVGKKILIVDDDVRNIFAITSVLERQSMEVISVESGADALRALKEKPDIEIVLMDVMMPAMDGYETMRAIRKIGMLQSLPIIAVTARAMKGDREKCLEAGASDYIAKPVDTPQLLSVLRAWLCRS